MTNSQSYGRLLKVQTLKRYQTQKEYVLKHINDFMFMEFLNLALNPDYKTLRSMDLTRFGYGTDVLDISTLIQAVHNNTIEVYLGTLHTGAIKVLNTILSTKLQLTHKEVIALRLDNTVSLKNLNELPATYGAPKFPCFVQIVDHDVQYYNILLQHPLVKVTTKDGLTTSFPNSVFKALKRLKFSGRIIGFIKDNSFIITNAYTATIHPETFATRFTKIETAILQLSKEDQLRVKTVQTNYVSSLKQAQEVVNTDPASLSKSIMFKQDAPPKYGRSGNLVMLTCKQVKNLIF